MRAARPEEPTTSNHGAEKDEPVTTGRMISIMIWLLIGCWKRIRLMRVLGSCYLFFDLLHGSETGFYWTESEPYIVESTSWSRNKFKRESHWKWRGRRVKVEVVVWYSPSHVVYYLLSAIAYGYINYITLYYLMFYNWYFLVDYRILLLLLILISSRLNRIKMSNSATSISNQKYCN